MPARLDEPDLKTDPFLSGKGETTPPAPSITDAITKSLAESSKALTAREKTLTEAEQQALARRKAVVTPALTGVKKAAAVPAPPTPSLLPEPPVPSTQARPFLDTDTKHALQAVVAGIGTLVTAGFGGKAPTAALQALTGAMTGWAEGDAERASREWQQYEATVSKLQRENAAALKRWEMARTLRADDLEAAKVILEASLADVGLDQYAVEVAEKGWQRAGQNWTMTYNILTKLQEQQHKALRDQIMALSLLERKEHAITTEEETARHHRAIESLGRGPARVATQQAKLITDIGKLDTAMLASDQKAARLSDLREAVALLDSVGAIPKGPTWQEKKMAEAKLNLFSMKRPDIANAKEVVNRWGTSILTGQEIEFQSGKVGVLRFKTMAEAEAGNVLAIPKVFWDQTLTDMEQFQTRRKSSLARQRKDLQRTLSHIHAGGAPTMPPGEPSPERESLEDVMEQLGVTMEPMP